MSMELKLLKAAKRVTGDDTLMDVAEFRPRGAVAAGAAERWPVVWPVRYELEAPRFNFYHAKTLIELLKVSDQHYDETDLTKLDAVDNL